MSFSLYRRFLENTNISYPPKLTSMIAVVLAVILAGTIAITSSIQKVNVIGSQGTGAGAPLKQAAPVATSGDKNV